MAKYVAGTITNMVSTMNDNQLCFGRSLGNLYPAQKRATMANMSRVLPTIATDSSDAPSASIKVSEAVDT